MPGLHSPAPSPTGRALVLVLVLAVFSLPTFSDPSAPSPGALLRFPTLHGETVVFSSGGDLWSAPLAGGPAHRLTVDPGEERNPRFSPDGRWIAFSASIDGNRDVYVMNPDGGQIQRVTYHPAADEVLGWHPTRNLILFRSAREGYPRMSRLFLISPQGTDLEELPFPNAEWGSFSPDGQKMVYTLTDGSDRTWKHYRGGQAPDLFLYDFTTKTNTSLTDFPGTDALPLWVGSSILFLSDRNGRLDLYSIDPTGGEPKRLTQFADFDIRHPATDGRRVIFENGGNLWLLDPAAGPARPLAIEVRSDAPDRRPYLREVKEEITDFAPGPTGARALAVARGGLFSLPKEGDGTRTLIYESGARVRAARWSPDGRQVAFLWDKSGEWEIWLQDPAGEKPPRQLTHLGPGYRHGLLWSPDGKKIAFADELLQLLYVDVDTEKVVIVDKAAVEPMDIGLDEKPIADAAWSPDSRYLAYSKLDPNQVFQLFIYPLELAHPQKVSDGRFNDFQPVFTPDGEHLLFISNRHFSPTFCDLDWEIVYKKVAGVYALTLRRDGPPLLPPKGAEEGTVKPEPATSAPATGGAKTPSPRHSKNIRVDFDGLAGRIEGLPLEAGNYRRPAVNENRLFLLDADAGDFNRVDLRDRPERKLIAFAFKERELQTVADGLTGYQLSADGEQLLLFKDKKLSFLPAAAGPESRPTPLALADLRLLIDPPAEWRQIFEECWRLERDFFYDSAMVGLDWKAIGDRYRKLLPLAADRVDLEWLLGELIGELGTSHTYVTGGARRHKAEPVSVGFLGADFDLDPAARRFKIRRILRQPDYTKKVFPPLARPGLEIQEGDYLLRVNGREVVADREIYAYFQDLGGREATLTVGPKPNGEGAHRIAVKLLENENALRYRDWVEQNRLFVERASQGRIGYFHLPDTFEGMAREFPEGYYTQTQKEGLIVDGRFNGGGLDPDVVIQKLARTPVLNWTRRHSKDYTTPLWSSRAHMALLTNRFAGSGGDMLPFLFREAGLGPVIGTRTWGGLVGISMFVDTIDGGGITAPDYRVYNNQSQWVVENEGVKPDVDIDADPASFAAGKDVQLDEAVQYLLLMLETQPRSTPPARPAIPPIH